MNAFQSLGLPSHYVSHLEQLGFINPTPIQSATLPLALSEKDIIGSAPTGSGKTAAYVLPLLVALEQHRDASALILAPTRELAMQIAQAVKELAPRHVSFALLIGGEPFGPQFRSLRRQPRCIIGTPGRVHDHIERRSLNLEKCNYLVLDETDRMLDLNFSIQIDAIVKHLPEHRQTLMFSATLSPRIEKLAEAYLNEPERVAIASSTPVTQAHIEQTWINVKEKNKFTTLLEQVEPLEGSGIIFVKMKRDADDLAERLQEAGWSCAALHGDLRQQQRTRIIQRFRQNRVRLLVATDVAARGLDIPHVTCVINYALPQCPEDYVHRIGRTGRAGATGQAINLVSPSEVGKKILIERLLDPKKQTKSQERSNTRSKRPYSYGKSDQTKPRSHFNKKHSSDNRRDDAFEPKKRYPSEQSERRFNNRDESDQKRPFSRDQNERRFNHRDTSDQKRSFSSDQNERRFNNRDAFDQKRPFSKERNSQRAHSSDNFEGKVRSFKNRASDERRTPNKTGSRTSKQHSPSVRTRNQRDNKVGHSDTLNDLTHWVNQH